MVLPQLLFEGGDKTRVKVKSFGYDSKIAACGTRAQQHEIHTPRAQQINTGRTSPQDLPT